VFDEVDAGQYPDTSTGAVACQASVYSTDMCKVLSAVVVYSCIDAILFSPTLEFVADMKPCVWW
jgi:hypothetical protein